MQTLVYIIISSSTYWSCLSASNSGRPLGPFDHLGCQGPIHSVSTRAKFKLNTHSKHHKPWTAGGHA